MSRKAAKSKDDRRKSTIGALPGMPIAKAVPLKSSSKGRKMTMFGADPNAIINNLAKNHSNKVGDIEEKISL